MTFTRIHRADLLFWGLSFILLLGFIPGISRAQAAPTSSTLPSAICAAPEPSSAAATATSSTLSTPSTSTASREIKQFSINSPFDVDYKSPLGGEGKRLWARSFLWEQAPKLVVDEWITSRPGLKNKYVLIAIWATWCSKSRNSIPLFNALQKKYGRELVVVTLTDESADTLRAFAKKTWMEFALAVDPLGRMKRELGVTAIPHVILLEPGGRVIWEGFPLLKGYELTDQTVAKILALGRKKSVPSLRDSGVIDASGTPP